MNQELIDKIKEIVQAENVLTDEPMSRHTTFKCGGPAKCFVRIKSSFEAAALIKLLKSMKQCYYCIGNGSNLLVSDEGFDGVIIELHGDSNDIGVMNNTITANAGVLNGYIARKALENSLSGFEFAAGIPGSIGGAVVMNAGAYGSDISHVIISAEAVDADGNVITINKNDMELGYRTSIFRTSSYIITSVKLELDKGEQSEISGKMNELMALRKEKQPLEYPSAGSTFKRPEGYFAGKLIMDAGLKGYTVGGAQVSEKHAGFVINRGGATAFDIYHLICDVKEKVYEKFGVELSPEVIMLGNFK